MHSFATEPRAANPDLCHRRPQVRLIIGRYTLSLGLMLLVGRAPAVAGRAVSSSDSAVRPRTMSQAQEARLGSRYLPDAVSDLYFGMSWAEFRRVRDVTAMQRDDAMGFRFQLAERGRGNVREITYDFDRDGKEPLYEIIIDYRPDFVARFAEERYGPPNHGNEWRFVEDGTTIMIWTFRGKLVLAAALPGTEWNEQGS